MILKKGIFFISLALLVSACARAPVEAPTWNAMGGSRADGTVKLAYEKTGKLNASDAQGLALAKKRCAAWGYQHAESFDYNSTTCLAYGKKRCRVWRIEREYQCTRPKDNNHNNNNNNNNNININVNVPSQGIPSHNIQGEQTLKPL